MKFIKSFTEYCLFERTFQEIFGVKNRFVEITKDNLPELSDNFYDLIQTAYSEIGGHLKIKSPTDLLHDEWNVWAAVDDDTDPDADAVLFGKTTRYGVKFSGIGHDGTSVAKKNVLNQQADMLKESGHIAEVSGKVAAIFINKYKCPYITEKHLVESVLRKQVKWNGSHPNPSEISELGLDGVEGWYTREINGHTAHKILIGIPSLSKNSDKMLETNMPDTVMYLHGLNSKPHSENIQCLKSLGYNVVAPQMDYLKYIDDDSLFKDLLNMARNKNVVAVIGNSMGGYMAFHISEILNIPCVLFNPALETRSINIPIPVSSHTNSLAHKTIVLGDRDIITPPKDTEEFLVQNNIQNYEIIHMNIEHRVSCQVWCEVVVSALGKSQ